MARLLRKIQKARWVTEGHQWLSSGDLQASALNDLKTEENALSVWELTPDDANLVRIVAALAAAGDHLSHLDYVVFDADQVSELGIGVRNTEGASPDDVANRLWHRDLEGLSVKKLASLALGPLFRGERKRIQRPNVEIWLRGSLSSGCISADRLKPDLKVKLGVDTPPAQ